MTISSTALRIAPALLLSASALAQNDECTGAIALNAGALTVFDTSTSTASAPAWPCATGGGPDLWYSYTATADGTVEFTTCGSLYDTALEVFGGPCASLTSIACNDDDCNLQSTVRVFGATMGTTYYCRVGGFNGASGQGVIVANEVPVPQPTGSVSAWVNAVNAGTAPSYVGTGYLGPAVDDVGTRNTANGNTYEFVVYGDNGGISSGLLGAVDASFIGEGLKFEQCCDSGEYGITNFGVADYWYAGIPNTPNVDIHLAFVVDTNAGLTELFENGTSLGTVNFAPVLEGMQGIGQIYRATGNFDVMTAGVVHGLAIYDGQLTQAEIQGHANAYFGGGTLGTNYCTAVPNSSGQAASISADGSIVAADNDLTLHASGVPVMQFGIFLTSRDQASAPVASGTLCLGGSIIRFQGAGQILQADMSGEYSLQIDTTALPAGTPTPIVAGDTYNFTTWFRDVDPMIGNTANFSDGVSILFQ